MISLYKPKLEDLWFRQMFMADEETMSYNNNWGRKYILQILLCMQNIAAKAMVSKGYCYCAMQQRKTG